MSKNSPPVEATLARLRTLVACCAEHMRLGTNSSALTPEGQVDLGYVFPRTAALAGLTHVHHRLESHHDETIQSRGVYHLFRLPTALEARIHEILLRGVELPASRDDALAEIETLAESTGFPMSGSIDLGSVNLQAPGELRRLAGAYRRGFRAGNLVTPFFTLPG